MPEFPLDLSAEVLRGMFENLSEAVVVANADHQIAYINPAGEALFGFDSAELVGEPMTTLQPQRATGTPGQVVRSGLIPNRRRDGADFLGETITNELGSSGGAVEGYIVDPSGQLVPGTNFSRPEATRPFSTADLSLTTLIADWAGHAISAERAREELENRAQRGSRPACGRAGEPPGGDVRRRPADVGGESRRRRPPFRRICRPADRTRRLCDVRGEGPRSRSRSPRVLAGPRGR